MSISPHLNKRECDVLEWGQFWLKIRNNFSIWILQECNTIENHNNLQFFSVSQQKLAFLKTLLRSSTVLMFYMYIMLFNSIFMITCEVGTIINHILHRRPKDTYFFPKERLVSRKVTIQNLDWNNLMSESKFSITMFTW